MPRDVAVYIHDLKASGVVRNAVAIAGRLARDHDVGLIVAQGDGFLGDSVRDGPIPVTVTGGSTLPGRVTALRRRLRADRPRILLSAGNLGHAAVRLATVGADAPMTMYRISNAVDRVPGRASPLRRIGARMLTQGAGRLLLVGSETARSPVFAGAIASGHALIVPNGVDATRARRQAQAPVPHPWLLENIPVVIAVSRLHRQKDLPTLVRAVARMQATRPVRLVILGDGPAALRSELVQLAGRLGIAGRLLLPGNSGNVFAWLGRASAFALPSLWEGSSVALLEAMACGVPIVAAHSAGDAAAVLGGGRYGRLVPPGDPDALAAALLDQLSDRVIRPGRRADDFALDQTLSRYADAVATALDETRAAA